MTVPLIKQPDETEEQFARRVHDEHAAKVRRRRNAPTEPAPDEPAQTMYLDAERTCTEQAAVIRAARALIEAGEKRPDVGLGSDVFEALRAALKRST